jgi:hypothetical protein
LCQARQPASPELSPKSGSCLTASAKALCV